MITGLTPGMVVPVPPLRRRDDEHPAMRVVTTGRPAVPAPQRCSATCTNPAHWQGG